MGGGLICQKYTPNIAWTGRPCLLSPGWVTRETPATRKVTKGRTSLIIIPFYGAVFAANIFESPGFYLAATRFARNAWFSLGIKRPGSGAPSSLWRTSKGTGGPSTVRPRGVGTRWSWWIWPAGLRVIEWHRRPWRCSREMVLLNRYVYWRFPNTSFLVKKIIVYTYIYIYAIKATKKVIKRQHASTCKTQKFVIKLYR